MAISKAVAVPPGWNQFGLPTISGKPAFLSGTLGTALIASFGLSRSGIAVVEIILKEITDLSMHILYLDKRRAEIASSVRCVEGAMILIVKLVL